MKIWKTRYVKCIDFRRQRINNKILGWAIISWRLRYFLESYMILKNWAFIKTLLSALKLDTKDCCILVDFW